MLQECILTDRSHSSEQNSEISLIIPTYIEDPPLSRDSKNRSSGVGAVHIRGMSECVIQLIQSNSPTHEKKAKKYNYPGNT